MKWDADADRLLLYKLIETHQLIVNTEKIAQTWPVGKTDGMPTARAVQERISKIKKLFAERTEDNGKDASPGTKGRKSAAGAVQKVRKTPTKQGRAPKKGRQMAKIVGDDHPEDDAKDGSTPKTEADELMIKEEVDESDGAEHVEMDYSSEG
ncbi:MAG: hypothetical protein M1814_000054 [Vezdaea aestivalis]|nr:MAG: hypothetical protein M1814_000054 [Vezdaea aestivalis]